MNYRKAVTEGRSLVKRSESDQWRLAELTTHVLAEGREGKQWAADIGVSASHVSRLGKVWAKYGLVVPHNRPTFANAYAEATGMPVERSERRLAEATSNIRKATPERQHQVARELVSDPAVARTFQNVLSEQAELEVMAGGGRIRPLSEVNSATSPMDGMIARGNRLNDGILTVKRGIELIAACGELTDDEQREVQALSLALIDLVAVH